MTDVDLLDWLGPGACLGDFFKWASTADGNVRPWYLRIGDPISGRLFGFIGLYVDNDRPWIGSLTVQVVPEHQCQGVMTAAVRLVVRWAFDDVGLQRVEGTTDVGNVAARGGIEKAGFELEGILRRAGFARSTGEHADMACYSVVSQISTRSRSSRT